MENKIFFLKFFSLSPKKLNFWIWRACASNLQKTLALLQFPHVPDRAVLVVPTGVCLERDLLQSHAFVRTMCRDWMDVNKKKIFFFATALANISHQFLSLHIYMYFSLSGPKIECFSHSNSFLFTFSDFNTLVMKFLKKVNNLKIFSTTGWWRKNVGTEEENEHWQHPITILVKF